MWKAPEVGQVYWIDTRITLSDQKARRPLVVVQVPVDHLGFVHTITRTSDQDRNGIPHPADASLGLSEDGVFSMKHHRRIAAHDFAPPWVELMGTLPDPYLARVLDMWENL